MRYAFAEFVLDCGTRQLLRAGREVPLGPKAFELLELLIRSRPKAVSQTRLRAALWPGTHVGPTSLHVLVSQVRAVLGDDAQEPQWIRTVPRFGYAFHGDASEEEAGHLPETGGRPRLVLGEREWVLREGENVLGREEGAAVRIEAAGVSRHHARIVVRAGGSTVEDLGSKNGSFFGEERISSPRPLKDGDVIRLGRRVRLVFRQGGEEDTETEVSASKG